MHSILVSQPYHPWVSRTEAKDFDPRCRLGRADRGRFVLTPTSALDLKADLLGPNGERVTRRVKSMVIQSLHDLSRPADTMRIDELAETARHPGISAKFWKSSSQCTSFHRSGDEQKAPIALETGQLDTLVVRRPYKLGRTAEGLTGLSRT